MSQPLYVCGHSTGELERLEIQGAFYQDITREVFRKVGLSPGMRVLDIGCGAGDVSLLAGELVGVSGSVLGVDHAPEAIAAATERARARALKQVAFQLSGIEELVLDAPVDALVGRFVLMHQADPARTLRRAARHVRPGGIVAMMESHLTASVPGVHSTPHSPTYHRILTWMIEIIGRAGAHPDMGLKLRQTFVGAGLPPPELWLQARVEGGLDAAIYRYMVESLRSMLPLAQRFGIATVSADQLGQLEERLREEVMASGGVITSPVVVGAWCRLP